MPKFSGFRLIVKGTPIKLKRIREGFKSPQPFKTILQSDPYQYEDEVFFKNGAQIIFPITYLETPYLSDDGSTLEYSFATGWSMTIRFVRQMCQVHKVSAYLGFSESWYGFSGRFNFDDKGVAYDFDFFAGKDGLYFIDPDNFFDTVWEKSRLMKEAYDNNLSTEQFVAQYAFFMELKDQNSVGLKYEEFVNKKKSSK
ncbi:MAG: hypothetical protein FJX80_11800 [Bacteroidetes bacterium]|nr:hypothetical protein [Bacteroidota bacterium]